MLLCCEGDGLGREVSKFSMQDLPKAEYSFSCVAWRNNGSFWSLESLPPHKIVKLPTLKAANIGRELTLMRQKTSQLFNVLLSKKNG